MCQEYLLESEMVKARFFYVGMNLANYVLGEGVLHIYPSRAII